MSEATPYRTIKIEGKILIVAKTREDADEAHKQCVDSGIEVLGAVQPYGRGFAFTCVDPDAAANDVVNVRSVGMQKIISGTTQRGVEHKVTELVRAGARLLSPTVANDGGWIAICDDVEQLHKW